ncbi:sugar transporter [Pelagimonas sp. KU-00592-HH]|uniref:sugar transporter n=1 Tax=Pelagimonas sp. KU-00592-HH TaxID=3127651 RepID=UPI00333E71D5
MAEPVTAQRRHWGILLSGLLMVVLPIAVIVFYLWTIAVDQYSSQSGFTVRSEESGSATDLLGGIAAFTGGGTQTDADILYEFIQSQEIVERVNAKIDLVEHYSANWTNDPVFSIWPDASIEDLHWYWERFVRISYDQKSGLIDLQVLAFDAVTAQRIAQEIVNESQAMINALNTTAREDAMRYATEDLEQSIQRLKDAREALTRFRTRTQIVDPQTDIEGRLGVLNNLQQQLAEALVEADILLETTSESDPRLIQANQKINVIRARIAHERKTFATDSDEIGSVGEDYPTLIAEFESLTVDLNFAEEAYRAALTALDVAKANAIRQSRYLATFIRPTFPETAEYPQRFVITALMSLLIFLVWGILILVYYSIRDRK